MSGTNESAAEPDSTNVTAASEQEKSTDALEKKEDCVTEPEKPENKCENEKATPMPSVADENEATGSTDKQHEPEQTPPQKECNEEKTGDVKTEEKPSVDQEKASPLQEKIIRQMEVGSSREHITNHVSNSFVYTTVLFWRSKFSQGQVSPASSGV